MGAIHSSDAESSRLPMHYKPCLNNPGLYQSMLDHSILVHHQKLLKNKTDHDLELDTSIFRKCNSDSVLAPKYFYTETGQYCHGSCKVNYFFDRVSWKLSEVQNFKSVCEGYAALISALSGFLVLTKKYSFWKVTADMIFCIDDQIKVWLNEDILSMTPQTTVLTQTEFIKIILKIFDQRISTKSITDYQMLKSSRNLKDVQQPSPGYAVTLKNIGYFTNLIIGKIGWEFELKINDVVASLLTNIKKMQRTNSLLEERESKVQIVSVMDGYSSSGSRESKMKKGDRFTNKQYFTAASSHDIESDKSQQDIYQRYKKMRYRTEQATQDYQSNTATDCFSGENPFIKKRSLKSVYQYPCGSLQPARHRRKNVETFSSILYNSNSQLPSQNLPKSTIFQTAPNDKSHERQINNNLHYQFSKQPTSQTNLCVSNQRQSNMSRGKDSVNENPRRNLSMCNQKVIKGNSSVILQSPPILLQQKKVQKCLNGKDRFKREQVKKKQAYENNQERPIRATDKTLSQKSSQNLSNDQSSTDIPQVTPFIEINIHKRTNLNQSNCEYQAKKRMSDSQIYSKVNNLYREPISNKENYCEIRRPQQNSHIPSQTPQLFSGTLPQITQQYLQPADPSITKSSSERENQPSNQNEESQKIPTTVKIESDRQGIFQQFTRDSVTKSAPGQVADNRTTTQPQKGHRISIEYRSLRNDSQLKQNSQKLCFNEKPHSNQGNNGRQGQIIPSSFKNIRQKSNLSSNQRLSYQFAKQKRSFQKNKGCRYSQQVPKNNIPQYSEFMNDTNEQKLIVMKQKDLLQYVNSIPVNRAIFRKLTTIQSIPCVEEQQFSYVDTEQYQRYQGYNPDTYFNDDHQ